MTCDFPEPGFPSIIMANEEGSIPRPYYPTSTPSWTKGGLRMANTGLGCVSIDIYYLVTSTNFIEGYISIDYWLSNCILHRQYPIIAINEILVELV